MSEIEFETAAKIISELPKHGPVEPSTDQRLTFYKWYKQATEGDIKDPRPSGLMNFAEKAKWDAWNSVKGESKEKAREEYVKAFLKIFSENESPEAKKALATFKAVSERAL